MAGAAVSVLVNVPDSGHSTEPVKSLAISHNPPLIVDARKTVELGYQVVCQYEQTTEHECAPSGIVHLKTTTGTVDLPLRRGGADRKFEYYTAVPAVYAVPGHRLDYWATFTDATSGGTGMLPVTAAAAPSSLWLVATSRTVALPADFSAPRVPDAVLASGTWGRGSQQFGLEPGNQSATIGASSFDVASDGTIVVLDQINHRLQRYRDGQSLDSTSVQVSGARADLALTADGEYAVLEEVPDAQTLHPTVKRFGTDGTLLSTQSVADESADTIRNSAAGLAVHALPSDHWQPLGDPAGKPFTYAQIAQGGTAARNLGAASLLVKVDQAGMRVAEISGTTMLRSWHLTSASWLGEYQVAAIDGDDLVVVIRQFSETQSQFRYARVSPTGLTKTFTIDPAEWAETAPLSRLRLVGEGLYQARSTKEGMSIVRFNVGS